MRESQKCYLQFRVSEETHLKLKQYCQDMDVTMTDVLDKIVTEFVKNLQDDVS